MKRFILVALLLIGIIALYVGCPMNVATGPGGGMVFTDAATGRRYECSPNLGNGNWEEGKTLAATYRGGGYNDWILPTTGELDALYRELRVKGHISDNGVFWSSATFSVGDFSGNSVYGLDFTTGQWGTYSPDTTQAVFSVRPL